MSSRPPKKEQRGGGRLRSYANKGALGDIDHKAISQLLAQLAPGVSDEQERFALAITVKGIEVFREHAPSGRALTTSVQQNRRELKKFMNGKSSAGTMPFNGFVCFNGKLYATSSSGLFEIKDTPLSDETDPYLGLDKAIANPLRTFAMVHQAAAGFKHLNPNLPFNSYTGEEEDGDARTIADALLDGHAQPRDWLAELAGYVYLALVKGLTINASMHWFEGDSPKSKKGWNFGRLLSLAGTQAGGALPNSRRGMEGLMRKGKACAEKMLAPAITYPDDRTISYFEMEFPQGPEV